ncbi:MAG: cytidylate kinase family protein [Candidatus Aenigmarchaeota archaeon]|nr:cytidylate kinase family protein [Candidatus Aenigmarchaeota archaeon]
MPVIVISGQPGCGSSTTAKLLAKKLRLKHFSVGDYNKSHVRKGRETEKSIVMWKTRKGASKKFHIDSDALAKEYAKKGNIVIDGKLQIKLAKGFYDFSVWLKAPKKVRAERYARRDKITLKEAEKKLREKEKLERKNWLRIYGFNYFSQQEEADLVLDTADKKPEKVVEIIIRKLRARGLVE